MEFAEIYMNLSRGGTSVGGDAQAQGHEGEIELFDWGWGLALEEQSPQPGSEAEAQGTLVAFSKPVDSASVPMMSILQSGEVCSQAVLTMRQRTEKPVTIKMVLKNVRLTSYDLEVECDDNEVTLSEDWKMSYETVDIQYVSAMAAKVPGGNAMKSFHLPKGRGGDQAAPQRPPKEVSADLLQASSGTHSMDKADVVKIVEEYLKKAKLLK